MDKRKAFKKKTYIFTFIIRITFNLTFKNLSYHEKIK